MEYNYVPVRIGKLGFDIRVQFVHLGKLHFLEIPDGTENINQYIDGYLNPKQVDVPDSMDTIEVPEEEVQNEVEERIEDIKITPEHLSQMNSRKDLDLMAEELDLTPSDYSNKLSIANAILSARQTSN